MKTKEGEVPFCVFNAEEEPCVIHRGTRMGILAPIDSSKNLKREEHLKPDCSDCSCQCVCSEKVRAVVHQFVVYNDCKQEDAKPQTRAGCCNQLQVVPPERRYHALVATTHCKRDEEINEFKFADKVPAHI